ncbi:MAG: hypothetical protein K9W46_00105 [Candidatus Heimdallarchaeum endolithica]|uniref:Uncharacterized protein n=1 Tax=Candidatus Heimdallarchaeum endolithica TaxID=2876572 RepID=A0A9Y1BR01_9ARCH|nr:MAG: hypothetical protein K9W46_00105 [Candidatus Heimdallarchaeum endolithica]
MVNFEILNDIITILAFFISFSLLILKIIEVKRSKKRSQIIISEIEVNYIGKYIPSVFNLSGPETIEEQSNKYETKSMFEFSFAIKNWGTQTNSVKLIPYLDLFNDAKKRLKAVLYEPDESSLNFSLSPNEVKEQKIVYVSKTKVNSIKEIKLTINCRYDYKEGKKFKKKQRILLIKGDRLKKIIEEEE